MCKSSSLRLNDVRNTRSGLKPAIEACLERRHAEGSAAAGLLQVRSFENTLVYGISPIAQIDAQSAGF
jgi:hypothetical protein